VLNKAVSQGAESDNSDKHQQGIPQFFRIHYNSVDGSRP
jgi:hypothetical protein